MVNDLRDLITALLNTSPSGYKNTEIVGEVLDAGYESRVDISDIGTRLYPTLELMSIKGQLVEVEFVMPGSNTIKSLYLPLGTRVRVRNAQLLYADESPTRQEE